ncbi:MAG TPA: radical SAM protein, partial [Methanobacterium sp.]|nr:radical SAM protein [Methanobacterium sp.]
MLREHNVVIKDPRRVDLRFASCYPNLYRSAMSSLGFHIIYDFLNSREDVYCERVVYPYFKSLESGSPLKDFDVVSFSLQYEQDYFNVLEMLRDGGIPIRKSERTSDDPLIIAGGPCASSNPAPMTDFIDIFLVGEAEVMLDQFINMYLQLEDPKKELDAFLDIKGVYVPGNPVEMVVVEDMQDAWQPIKQVVPETEDENFIPAFGRAFLLGVSRGCTRGCRFCMAGCMYRPRREAPLKDLLDLAEKCRKATHLNRVALIGAAVSDYSQIEELCMGLFERGFQI